MRPMARIHHRTCPLCEAMCGLTLAIDGDRVASVRGDDDDPFSRGYICPKGAAIAGAARRSRSAARAGAPHREAAGRRSDGTRRSTRSPVASTRCSAATASTRSRSTWATPTVHNLGTVLYGPPLSARTAAAAIATRRPRSISCRRCWPSYLMYGHQLLLPIPDVDHTDHMVILGANPLVSQRQHHERARHEAAARGDPRPRRQGRGRSIRAAPRPPRSPTSTCRCVRAPTRCCWPR